MDQWYPKWIFASGGRAKQVDSPETEAAEGPGWYSHPSLIPSGSPLPPAAAPVEPPTEKATQRVAFSPVPPAEEAWEVEETPAPAVEELPAPPPLDPEEQLRAFWARPVSAITAQLADVRTMAALEALRSQEEQRPGGPRKTVFAALDARQRQVEKGH